MPPRPARFDRFQARPQPGCVAYGVHVSLLVPEALEIYGLLGFEWAFLDAEHGPLSHETCRQLVRGADVAGIPCAVRVPQVVGAVIEGYLDAGAIGIIAPDIASADQAQALVAATRFPPRGTRGAASRTRAAEFGLTQPPEDFISRSNSGLFTVALIESADGLKNAAAIAMVEGIDYVGIGPSDLSLSLGLPQGASDPALREIVSEAHARIRATGKPLFVLAKDRSSAKAAVDAGAGLIAIPDIVLLETGAREFLPVDGPG